MPLLAKINNHNKKGEKNMVNLVKGQKVDLTKGNEGLKQIIVGLGWDVNKYDGDGFDLDASAFLLGSNGKVRNSGDFVYFNNLRHSSGSVEHMGDNLTGEGNGDDEQIIVDLTKIPADVEKIAFTVTIYMAEERLQNFGMVSNSYIRMTNKETGEEMIRYDLGEDYSTETTMVLGELYRHNGEWKFNAIGAGYSGGLQALCNSFGV